MADLTPDEDVEMEDEVEVEPPQKRVQEFIKPGKVVILLQGRRAGSKAVVLQNVDKPDHRRYNHSYAYVCGISKYPKPVYKKMTQRQVERRTRFRCFLKRVAYQHLMPTRYVLSTEGFPEETEDLPAIMEDFSRKRAACIKMHQSLEDRYLSGKNHCEQLTWVWRAIASGDLEGLRSVIADDECIPFTRSQDSRGPMFWAHEFGHGEIIEYLVSVGVPLDDVDRQGMTPVELGNLARIRQQQYEEQQAAAAAAAAASYSDDDDEIEEERETWKENKNLIPPPYLVQLLRGIEALRSLDLDQGTFIASGIKEGTFEWEDDGMDFRISGDNLLKYLLEGGTNEREIVMLLKQSAKLPIRDRKSLVELRGVRIEGPAIAIPLLQSRIEIVSLLLEHQDTYFDVNDDIFVVEGETYSLFDASFVMRSEELAEMLIGLGAETSRLVWPDRVPLMDLRSAAHDGFRRFVRELVEQKLAIEREFQNDEEDDFEIDFDDF